MKAILTVLLVGVVASMAMGQAYEGAIVFQGGHGAKALGMGGAFTALAIDGSAALWNPAGLVHMEGAWLSGATANLFAGGDFEGAGYQYVAGGFNFEGYSLAVSWGNASAGPLYSASAFMGSVAVHLQDIAAVGANLKYYMETIDGETASGFGFDIGMGMHLTEELKIGILAQDVGGTGMGAGQTVTPAYKAGMAVGLLEGAMNLSADVKLVGAFELADIRTGLEVVLIENLAIRAGVVVPEADFGQYYFTLGAGVAFAGLSIDAAYVLQPEPGETLYLSATFMFGELFAPEGPVETPPAQ